MAGVLDKEPQITGETGGEPPVIDGAGGRGPRGRFAQGASGNPNGRYKKGQSGNPNGRPRGTGKFRAGSRAAAELLDAQAEVLAEKAIEMAVSGDPVAVRFCLGRVLGVRRGQLVELDGAFAMPEITRPSDLVAAINRIAAAAMQGAITPDEAFALSRMVDSFNRSLERGWVERVRLWRGRLWRMRSGPKSGRKAFGLEWAPPKWPFATRATPALPSADPSGERLAH